MPRFKNVAWDARGRIDTEGYSHADGSDQIHTALLMDIRDELQALNYAIASRGNQTPKRRAAVKRRAK